MFRRDMENALMTLQPKERFYRTLLLVPFVLILVALIFIVPGGNWNLPVKIIVSAVMIAFVIWRLIVNYTRAKAQLELEKEEKSK
ncbi:hypothetical protein MKY91_07405 [Alkalicoccobacillus gibsonii]|uniref:Uncharacterized protein n=1 Tax=Alkalicoccobacillus gibsonii TaxID=79881 RepID=A0ABU9VGL2_9BACI